MTRVVQDVSLDIRPGEVHGLIGESGSGKTQTAWSVLRLLPPGGQILAGSILLDGEDLANASAAAMREIRGRRIAYIPQEPMSNLDPSFTVGSQLTEPIRLKLGLSRNEARAKALDLLARVGIPDPKRTFAAYPHELSGGMAQRVLIAGAVSCEPSLIIADEPTTALDVTIQAEILDLLRELQQGLGMAVLLVTHNFGVVADLCDRVSVMQNGRIVETGLGPVHLRRPTRSLHPVAVRRDLGGRPGPRLLRRNRGLMAPKERSSMPEPLLIVDDLVVEYPAKGVRRRPFRALAGVSIDIRPGETVGLVGESGSGKSTLGRALLGLAPVTSGSVKFSGREIGHLPRSERRALSSEIQVVFQDPYSSLNPSLTIERTLTEPLLAQRVPKQEAAARVRNLLDTGKAPARRARPAAARVQRRPAPAHRDRPRPGPVAQAGRVRRAGLGA